MSGKMDGHTPPTPCIKETDNGTALALKTNKRKRETRCRRGSMLPGKCWRDREEREKWLGPRYWEAKFAYGSE